MSAGAESVMYATFTNGTLTFKYGEKNKEDWTVYDTQCEPSWYNFRNEVLTVEFDPSFADARPKSCYYWFAGMEYLTKINHIEYLNTSEVTDMSYMFYACFKLATLDVSGFKTSKVTDMSYMFAGCSQLTQLDVSNFNTSNVENMNYMFGACTLMSSLNVSGFRTPKVVNMSRMFYQCANIAMLDVGRFDILKVKSMDSMFDGCTSLGTLFCNNTWSCESSTNMFKDCTSLAGYHELKSDVTYANPKTGYFTRKVYSYELWIAGTQVTDNNKDNLPASAGTVKYDPSTNVLYLTSATIAATGTNGKYKTAVYNEIPGLVIAVSGNNTVTSTSDAGIISNGSLRIYGTKNRKLSVSAPSALVMTSDEDNLLTVDGGLGLTLDGTTYFGVTSTNSNTVMRVAGADTEVRVRGVKECFSNLMNIILNDGIAFTEPTGVNVQKGTVYDASGNIMKDEWVKIVRDTIVRRIDITDYTWPTDYEFADYEVTSPTNGVKSVSVDYTMQYRTIDNYVGSANDNLGIAFTVELEDGYEFSADNDFSAFIERDGELVHQYAIVTLPADNQKRFVFTYSVPTPEGGTYMRTAKDTITAPVIGAEPVWEIAAAAGAKAAGALLEANAKEQFQREDYCPVDEITWFEVGGANMSRGDKFQPGKAYGVIMKISPVSGQQFHRNTVFNLNGETAQSCNGTFANIETHGAYCCLEGSTSAKLCYVFSALTRRLGDVNGDGSITMADANAIVNYFLAAEKPEGFDETVADVNGDGGITMADANAIVNMFLGQ